MYQLVANFPSCIVWVKVSAGTRDLGSGVQDTVHRVPFYPIRCCSVIATLQHHVTAKSLRLPQMLHWAWLQGRTFVYVHRQSLLRVMVVRCKEQPGDLVMYTEYNPQRKTYAPAPSAPLTTTTWPDLLHRTVLCMRKEWPLLLGEWVVWPDHCGRHLL